jgi:predicted transcriptional regulator
MDQRMIMRAERSAAKCNDEEKIIEERKYTQQESGEIAYIPFSPVPKVAEGPAPVFSL